MVDPNDYIAPRNGFAMSFRDFVPHLMNVLDQLGMSLHARTNFIRLVLFFSSNLVIKKNKTIVTTFPRSLRTKTSHIGSSRPVGLQQPSTFQSLTTHAFSLGCSLFSAACPTTTSGSLPVQAKKKQTQSTGGRLSAGQRNPRILRCSGSSRRLCWRLHRLFLPLPGHCVRQTSTRTSLLLYLLL